MATAPVDIVLGLQRGDEGKGRIVDLLSKDYDVVARFNGGPNAGHTIAYGDHSIALHQVPSGIRHPGTLSLIGNGALLDVVRLAEEVDTLLAAGIAVSPDNLAISSGAHLILPHHIDLDGHREAGTSAQGSTKRGIAYAAADKYQRSGIRAESLNNPEALRKHAVAALQAFHRHNGEKPELSSDELNRIKVLLDSAKRFAPYVVDSVALVHTRLATGQRVLAEGAQASSLDIEQAPYPFGSSSHCSTGGVLTGLSLGPRQIGEVIGVIKAVKSHVGDGPFVTEILDAQLAAHIRGPVGKIDSEYGSSTGRPRRIGYLDIPELRRAVLVNGVTQLVVNKVDKLPDYGDSLQVVVAYTAGDGRRLDLAPSSYNELRECRPVYQTLPLWDEDISGIRQFAELPPKAQAFIQFLSDAIGCEVKFIGVGPEHDQIIRR